MEDREEYGWFCLSSRRRHTRCALVTGGQTGALPVAPRQACRHAAQIVHAPRSPELEIARATRRAALVTRAPLHGRGPASRLGRMLQGSEQRNARAVFWEQEIGRAHV